MSLDFKSNFWAGDGFSVLNDRVYGDAKKNNKDLIGFLQQRAKLDQTYANGLRSLASSSISEHSFGTIKSAIAAFQADCESVANIHSETADWLIKTADEFKEFTKANSKERSDEVTEALNEIKGYKKLMSKLDEKKAKYEKACAEADRADLLYSRAVQDSNYKDNATDVNKAESKSKKANAEAAKHEEAYRDFTSKGSAARAGLISTIDTRLVGFQTYFENYLDWVSQKLIALRDHEKKQAKFLSSRFVVLDKVLNSISKDQDLHFFVTAHKTGPTKPNAIRFEPADRSGGEGESSGSGQVHTLYSYKAKGADELSFEADVIINVLDQDPSGWWEAEYKGKRGLIPSNHVEKVPKHKQTTAA